MSLPIPALAGTRMVMPGSTGAGRVTRGHLGGGEVVVVEWSKLGPGGGGIGSSSTHHTQTPFLHMASRICTSDIACPLATAGALPRVRGNVSLYH